MNGDPTSYALADLLPFTVEVYLRLVERQNGALWPAHLVALLLGVGALVATWRGCGRSVATLLGLAWVSVALTFHLRLFSELTFVAGYLAAAFVLQAALMLGCALLGGLTPETSQGRRGPAIVGYGLAGVGLVVFPLLGPSLGRGWVGSECFAVVPDPTVLVTLGLLLSAARPAWLALLLPIPLLWCALSAAVDTALELPLVWLLPAAAVVGIGGALWKAVGSARADETDPKGESPRGDPPE